MKTIKRTSFIFLGSVFAAASVSMHAVAAINPSTKIAAPTHDYIILTTVNANKGKLDFIKEKEYQLVLYGVHQQIVFKDKRHTPQSGTYTLDAFLRQWRQLGKGNAVEADVTGINVNQHTVGHQQVYMHALLKNPSYQDDKLMFKVTLLNEPKRKSRHHFKFSNVTLFINGCDLEAC